MKQSRISSLSVLIVVLGLITDTFAASENGGGNDVQNPKPQQLQQSEVKLNSANDLEPSENLLPPSSPLFEYSNAPNPRKYPSADEETGTQDEEEDMETAGTVIIGPHSGRYFGPGIWLGSPSINRYRNNYHYRPWQTTYYPRRYPNRYHNPGIWIGGRR